MDFGNCWLDEKRDNFPHMWSDKVLYSTTHIWHKVPTFFRFVCATTVQVGMQLHLSTKSQLVRVSEKGKDDQPGL